MAVRRLDWRCDLDRVILAMGDIEGDSWALLAIESLSDDDRHYVSLGGAVEWLQGVLSKDPYSKTFAEVYGDGGFNRYFLYVDGSVRFSCRHAWRPSDQRKAAALGFDFV